ncbi:hypothetical protein [Neptunomonas sp.]|uniref:hypothetical protein n=1 Tax=Neptunomonas sp. TaxID=1971898 RepID=UPI0035626214
MAVILHEYNIVCVSNGDDYINCTILKMHFDYALIKYQGEKYKVPYHLINKVVGHELLMTMQE